MQTPERGWRKPDILEAEGTGVPGLVAVPRRLGAWAGVGTGVVGLSDGPARAPCLSRPIRHLPVPLPHGKMREQLPSENSG